MFAAREMGNGSKFTVLSVATQRSWKNADDEWSSKTEWNRVAIFRPRLAERVPATIKKGAHVARRRKPGQLRLPAGEWQEQEKQTDEDHIVDDSS